MSHTVTLITALVLASKDTPSVPIIVFKDAPLPTREIAEVLAGCIEKISGKKPTVIEGAPQDRGWQGS